MTQNKIVYGTLKFAGTEIGGTAETGGWVRASDYERLRAALQMIETCTISAEGGAPVNVETWLRGLAHEALTGIDPRTGKP